MKNTNKAGEIYDKLYSMVTIQMGSTKERRHISMKIVLFIILLVVLSVIVAKLTHYSERMKEYNTYVCSQYGMQSDCKTALPTSERLK